MKMIELIRYDLPEEIVALWQREESDQLLPLQELAIKQHGLFSNKNLLIQAPTSSGKTFIGEMAALQSAMRRKKVVYLVPLKALAEEKYRDFSAKYAAYGLKVLLSTRDHREDDQALESGDFSIAVVVYEKMAQLLVRRPERMKELDLVIADELEILSDPERGGVVELLLTRVLQAKRRLIGLSAVIGAADQLAKWLEADLVYFERRPVELRFGILYEGEFSYRTYNSGEEGTETLSGGEEDNFWDILLSNARILTEKGETCLVFVKTKQESRSGAAYLAEQLDLPPAQQALETLEHLEDTRSRHYLKDILSAGIGFHNADLSPDERIIVEQAFRAGEVRVIVSTGTLAVGLNLPARNVFVAPEKWRYDPRLSLPWKAPIQRSEYENMGGRAGRFGMGHAFGRSILIAQSPYDRETLWRRYVEGKREAIVPQLDREPLENHVLRLVASRYCRNVKELQGFLGNTLTGKWIWAERFTLDEEEIRVRAAIHRCVDFGVLQIDSEDRLEPTPLGIAIASKGISLNTAQVLENWLAANEHRCWTPLELLLQVASCEDGSITPVMLTSGEYEQSDYPGQIQQRLSELGVHWDTCGLDLKGKMLFEEVRGLKTALVLDDWLAMVPLRELEEQYNTMAGQLLAAADQFSWIVDAVAALAEALGSRKSFTGSIQTLGRRLQYGVLAEVLPFCALPIKSLTRNVVLAWHHAGILTPSEIAKKPDSVLREFLSPAEVKFLRQWARKTVQNAAIETTREEPVLCFDPHRPGEVLVEGHAVTLQEKQYKLLQKLAAHPGECVSYEDIYTAVWGDSIVESNQMHVQKRQLLRAFAKVGCQIKSIIKTVPKRGFMLMLVPEQVIQVSTRQSNAA